MHYQGFASTVWYSCVQFYILVVLRRLLIPQTCIDIATSSLHNSITVSDTPLIKALPPAAHNDCALPDTEVFAMVLLKLLELMLDLLCCCASALNASAVVLVLPSLHSLLILLRIKLLLPLSQAE